MLLPANCLGGCCIDFHPDLHLILEIISAVSATGPTQMTISFFHLVKIIHKSQIRGVSSTCLRIHLHVECHLFYYS
uniref:Secreted protein n=1 Tax=Mesocestoides corti TaxID=53468 RepID=A0A5K3EPQ0_MESCO